MRGTVARKIRKSVSSHPKETFKNRYRKAKRLYKKEN